MENPARKTSLELVWRETSNAGKGRLVNRSFGVYGLLTLDSAGCSTRTDGRQSRKLLLLVCNKEEVFLAKDATLDFHIYLSFVNCINERNEPSSGNARTNCEGNSDNDLRNFRYRIGCSFDVKEHVSSRSSAKQSRYSVMGTAEKIRSTRNPCLLIRPKFERAPHCIR